MPADYITKPFEHRKVLARVSAHLQQQGLFRRMTERLSSIEDSGSEQRLVRAQTLLAGDERQIRQVADEVGVKNTGDFATAFKRRFGLTPREYHKQQDHAEECTKPIPSNFFMIISKSWRYWSMWSI